MKDGRRRSLDRGFRLGLLALLAMGGPGAPPGARAAEDGSPQAETPRPAPKKKRGDLEWLSLGPGLVRMREKYLPALVLYDPAVEPPKDAAKAAGEDAAPRVFLAEHLTDTATRETLRRFVLVRLEEADLEKPYRPPGGDEQSKDGGKKKAGENDGEAKGPAGAIEAPPGPTAPAGESVAARLMLTSGRPSLVALSFREEVVRRFDGELPAKTKLRKDLSFVAKVNDIQAGEARRVEPEIEASRYAFKLGKTRDAVLKVLPFGEKDSRQRMDTVLAKRVDDLIEEYRGKAKEALAEGDRLDKERKHDDAIKAFDKAQKEFPFPEVIRQASRRKSEILRKMVTPF